MFAQAHCARACVAPAAVSFWCTCARAFIHGNVKAQTETTVAPEVAGLRRLEYTGIWICALRRQGEWLTFVSSQRYALGICSVHLQAAQMVVFAEASCACA